jgi:hypothetical protein
MQIHAYSKASNPNYQIYISSTTTTLQQVTIIQRSANPVISFVVSPAGVFLYVLNLQGTK